MSNRVQETGYKRDGDKKEIHWEEELAHERERERCLLFSVRVQSIMHAKTKSCNLIRLTQLNVIQLFIPLECGLDYVPSITLNLR